jgi:hypothetical protein
VEEIPFNPNRANTISYFIRKLKNSVVHAETPVSLAFPGFFLSFPRKRESRDIQKFLDSRIRGNDKKNSGMTEEHVNAKKKTCE